MGYEAIPEDAFLKREAKIQYKVFIPSRYCLDNSHKLYYLFLAENFGVS